MRELLVAAILCSVACVDEVAPPIADKVPVADPLGERVTRCGATPEQPLQEPALTTEPNGDTFVLLYPRDWDKYAAYMDTMKAWSDCIVYGVAP